MRLIQNLMLAGLSVMAGAAWGGEEEKVRTELLQAAKGIGEVFAEAKGFDGEDGDAARQAELLALYGKLMGHMVVFEKHEAHLKGALAMDVLEGELDGLMPADTRLTPAQRASFRLLYQRQESLLDQAGIHPREISGMLFVNPVKAGQGRNPRLTPIQRTVLGDAQIALTRELRQLLTEGQRACLAEAKVHLGWTVPGEMEAPLQAPEKPKLPKGAAPALAEEKVREEVMQAAKQIGELLKKGRKRMRRNRTQRLSGHMVPRRIPQARPQGRWPWTPWRPNWTA